MSDTREARIAAARAEFDRVVALARAEYERVVCPVRAEYKRALKEAEP